MQFYLWVYIMIDGTRCQFECWHYRK